MLELVQGRPEVFLGVYTSNWIVKWWRRTIRVNLSFIWRHTSQWNYSSNCCSSVCTQLMSIYWSYVHMVTPKS